MAYIKSFPKEWKDGLHIDKALQEKTVVRMNLVPLKGVPPHVECLSGTLCLSGNFQQTERRMLQHWII